MGGRALKHTFTRRYDSKEYYKLQQEIVEKCKKIYLVARPLIAYRNKDSFGDMDVLILNEGNVKDIRERIISEFQPNETHFNGNVWSFDYKELQIDFILTPIRNWESAYNFFAWNDLGNLMGKIAHKFDVKYGFDGLVFRYRTENERHLGDIVLSKDTEKIFEFLGFDYKRWVDGFDTMEEIFEYVISSKYFSMDIFQFENLNHIDKKRNKKRKMYNQFLEYVNKKNESLQIENSGIGLISYRFHKDKWRYYDKIEGLFPGFISELEKFEKKERIRKIIASKFNGGLVMERYGFEGKNLGIILGGFKAQFEDFSTYILETDEPEIWRDFEKFINQKNK